MVSHSRYPHNSDIGPNSILAPAVSIRSQRTTASLIPPERPQQADPCQTDAPSGSAGRLPRIRIHTGSHGSDAEVCILMPSIPI